MLGLGTSIIKGAGRASNLGIITDNLVLKHDYDAGRVHQVSTGAASINAEAAGTDFINVGTITIGTGDISVSAWVYVTSFVNYAGIFTNREEGGSQPGIEIRTLSSNKIECIIDDGNSSDDAESGELETNRWYHVCAVWDRSDKQFLYIDGVLVASEAITTESDTLNHSDDALIGKRTYGSGPTVTYFRGHICNVGYWNRVLSQAEVKSIWYKNYADLTTAEKTSLLSWWNLNEETNTSGNAGTGGVKDHHGSNHGALS